MSKGGPSDPGGSSLVMITFILTFLKTFQLTYFFYPTALTVCPKLIGTTPEHVDNYTRNWT